MHLLISDANILIDMEEGQLVLHFFQLPYEIAIPDILYFEEIEKMHPHLPSMGLKIRNLNPETLIKAVEIINRYPKTSRNDCFALMLAIQDCCPLLTGDLELRKAAEKEGVIVNGTIWIVEQMIAYKIITKQTAFEAYTMMRKSNRRLPWNEAIWRLQQYY